MRVRALALIIVPFAVALVSAQQREPDTAKSHAASAEAPSADTPGVTVDPPDARSDQQESNTQDDESDRLMTVFLEKLVDPVTYFTLLLVVVSRLQWLVMKRQSQHMRRGLAMTRRSNRIARAAANTAAVQLRAALMPCLDVRAVQFCTRAHPNTPDAKDRAWILDIEFEVSNVGGNVVRIEAVYVNYRIGTLPDWHELSVIGRTLGIDKSFAIPIVEQVTVKQHESWIVGMLAARVELIFQINHVADGTIYQALRGAVTGGYRETPRWFPAPDTHDWPGKRNQQIR